MLIRPARAEEAGALAALAVRSKGHWPYSAAFLKRFERTLGLTPEVVASNDVLVAERDGEVSGFYVLLYRDALAVLDDLWLEPTEIGRGCGRELFEHAAARAAAQRRVPRGGRAVRRGVLTSAWAARRSPGWTRRSAPAAPR